MKFNRQLKVLQWNMSAAPHAKPPKPHPNPKECAEALDAMLQEHNPTIVTLQETDNTLLSYAHLSAYEVQRGPTGLATLILRSRFRVVSNKEVTPRIQAVTLDNIQHGEPGILVLNFHLPVLNEDADDRQEAARTLIPKIDSARANSKLRLEIIAGDFNLPPYAAFIVGQSGLFANRDPSISSQRRSTVGRPLYNASWSIFGGSCGSLGTYRRASRLHGPWQIPDQMLLDPLLVDKAKVEVQVITKTSVRALHNRNGNPDRKFASDHFPVLVTISPNALIPYLNGSINDYSI
ncbi:endonuclease/exonuclease/phosphatase family protein [Hymenobacter tibetensis]|uniref:Endonuclease/exonuclease/phosphatase family protein n=1 Tax=Hymenobacter tibetensis TaxID=497967 RepID=A0ABY4D3E3_9BACT|nr:endonuclease/exonuclease/phosphatase family protein [Hymenobacter tibetensis]UOG76816.1 endonuclease/exonuclease/phosphatase family protein [Hymenobacter tibetensis]